MEKRSLNDAVPTSLPALHQESNWPSFGAMTRMNAPKDLLQTNASRRNFLKQTSLGLVGAERTLCANLLANLGILT